MRSSNAAEGPFQIQETFVSGSVWTLDEAAMTGLTWKVAGSIPKCVVSSINTKRCTLTSLEPLSVCVRE